MSQLNDSASRYDYDSGDRAFMARAIQLARKGLYSTMPNPRVGCVLVRDGSVVGEGWHRCAGEAHAEVSALRKAGQAAHNATAYVSLEPCNHLGRTGPCSEALIEAGVARVVIGMEDPNPLVAGSGVRRLMAAGIAVSGPVLEEEARALNPGFIKRMQSGRPLVRCKLAMSLDGRTAMASGESKWVTGPAARQDVQRLRARSCAIITGIGSILQDDSSLNLRPSELQVEDAELACSVQPLRVILDSRQRLPRDAKVLQSPAGLLLVSAAEHASAALADAGVEQLKLADASGRVDLERLLRVLAERECNEVLVEAGATLAGAFLRRGLLDELVIYMAPSLMGSEARPLFELPLQTMSGRLPLTITDIRAVGVDWRITARPDPDT